MADFGRITGITGESAITVPSGDAIGRVTGVISEAAITTPDDLARISGVIGEVVTTEVEQEMRVAYVFCEVFSKDPGTDTAAKVKFLGGVMGTRISTLRRK